MSTGEGVDSLTFSPAIVPLVVAMTASLGASVGGEEGLWVIRCSEPSAYGAMVGPGVAVGLYWSAMSRRCSMYVIGAAVTCVGEYVGCGVVGEVDGDRVTSVGLRVTSVGDGVAADGELVGSVGVEVVGATEGVLEGLSDGVSDGDLVGESDGALVATDGDAVSAVGDAVGTVGDTVGDLEGDRDGALDGDPDGKSVGDRDGILEGDRDGKLVGDRDGKWVGDLDGERDGKLVGDREGLRVGVVMSSESMYIELAAVNEMKARLRSAALSQAAGRESRSASNRVPEPNAPSYCFKTAQSGATNFEGPQE